MDAIVSAKLAKIQPLLDPLKGNKGRQEARITKGDKYIDEKRSIVPWKQFHYQSMWDFFSGIHN